MGEEITWGGREIKHEVASHSAGLSLQNAVHSQQALNQISSAVISKAVTMILSVGDKAA
jgi:hypothetical protein